MVWCINAQLFTAYCAETPSADKSDRLLKLGLQVNRGTIRRYMRQARRETPPQHTGQTWATFLANHVPQIWACDFLETYDGFFRTLFLFFIIEHGSRRVVHYAVTRAPSDAWVAQQIREATGFGVGPRCLICDNGDKYGVLFKCAVVGVHTELLHTPSKPRKPMPFVNVSSAQCGANAWTIS